MEKENKKSILDNLNNNLEPIKKAKEVQERVHSVGFEWKNVKGVLSKIKEEIQELENELKAGKRRDKKIGSFLINVNKFL